MNNSHAALRLGAVMTLFLYGFAAPLASSAIRGRVVDQTGSPVPGARIVISQRENSAGFSTVSTHTGEFYVALPPGKHRMVVSADGFVDALQDVEAENSSA